MMKLSAIQSLSQFHKQNQLVNQVSTNFVCPTSDIFMNRIAGLFEFCIYPNMPKLTGINEV